jgi:hypothetical protein
LHLKIDAQVVAATGTLAYGIHMPCRAVVMAGDRWGTTGTSLVGGHQRGGHSPQSVLGWAHAEETTCPAAPSRSMQRSFEWPQLQTQKQPRACPTGSLHPPAPPLPARSPFLDALNYAQMSGRSGRRGLDPKGHVVHYALPLDRVHALRRAACGWDGSGATQYTDQSRR